VLWCILSGILRLCHRQKNVEFSAFNGDLVAVEDVPFESSD